MILTRQKVIESLTKFSPKEVIDRTEYLIANRELGNEVDRNEFGWLLVFTDLSTEFPNYPQWRICMHKERGIVEFDHLDLKPIPLHDVLVKTAPKGKYPPKEVPYTNTKLLDE